MRHKNRSFTVRGDLLLAPHTVDITAHPVTHATVADLRPDHAAHDVADLIAGLLGSKQLTLKGRRVDAPIVFKPEVFERVYFLCANDTEGIDEADIQVIELLLQVPIWLKAASGEAVDGLDDEKLDAFIVLDLVNGSLHRLYLLRAGFIELNEVDDKYVVVLGVPIYLLHLRLW